MTKVIRQRGVVHDDYHRRQFTVCVVRAAAQCYKYEYGIKSKMCVTSLQQRLLDIFFVNYESNLTAMQFYRF